MLLEIGSGGQLHGTGCRRPAPKFRCQTLPEADWNALWLASCSALLDAMRATAVILRVQPKKEDTMSTTVTRTDEDTKTLYVAFELGERDWKLAMSVELHTQARLRTLRSRSLGRPIAAARVAHPREGAKSGSIAVSKG